MFCLAAVFPTVFIRFCFFSSRNMEDFVTWVDSSKIKQHVMNYNEEVSFKVFFNSN